MNDDVEIGGNPGAAQAKADKKLPSQRGITVAPAARMGKKMSMGRKMSMPKMGGRRK